MLDWQGYIFKYSFEYLNQTRAASGPGQEAYP